MTFFGFKQFSFGQSNCAAFVFLSYMLAPARPPSSPHSWNHAKEQDHAERDGRQLILETVDRDGARLRWLGTMRAAGPPYPPR